MIRDCKDLDDGALIEADVCVVGAGAAGISLALELSRHGRSVALLEGGGRKGSRASQEIYEGTAAPPLYDAYLFTSRLRFFGGTTNHWTGCCLPLDPLDFEQREWVPESGWPFARSELEPFYTRAAATCRVDAELAMAAPEALGASRVLVRRPQQVNALRFAEDYEPELSAAPGLDVYLHANVVQIHLRAGGTGVDNLEVATAGDKRLRARARAYVLAMGAIENARLMLVSGGVQSQGVGNQNDLVGRYFMDHPVYTTGAVCARGDSPLLKPNRWRSEYRYRLTPAVQARERLLSCSLDFRQLTQVEDPFQELAAEGSWQWTGGYLEAGGFDLGGFDLGGSARPRAGAELFRRRNFSFRPEQPPTPSSRVEFGDEKDRFGLPRVHLRWRLATGVEDTVERTAEIVSRELGRLGYGRLLLAQLDRVGAGYHHAGTTRMHPDPRQGVVDADAKVHGLSDLYVAGGSVFPTCGDANPTFTIVAMALRLADHLAGRLARERAA